MPVPKWTSPSGSIRLQEKFLAELIVGMDPVAAQVWMHSETTEKSAAGAI
jgi:hypothetical protein